MRLQASISGLLAVLLLAMSSWSSACDLSCSLASYHLGCEAGQTAQTPKTAEANASQMDMADCSHATPAASDLASGQQLANDPSIRTAPCSHEACRQVAVSTAAKRGADRIQQNAARWTAMATAQTAPFGSLFRPMEREDPPPETPPLVLLSTSLRI
jgi:hypothetical protein